MHHALAGMRRQIDDHQIKFGWGFLPMHDNGISGRLIVRPSVWLEEHTLNAADRGVVDGGEELFVDRGDFFIRWLVGPSAKLNRNLRPPAAKLAFIEKSHAGQTEHQQGGGAVFGGR